MAMLNLNFHEPKGCYKPTKSEIGELETLALSIKAIVQVMARYTNNDCTACGGNREPFEVTNNCASVFNALELLVEPLVKYMSDYAGKEAAPKSGEEGNHA